MRGALGVFTLLLLHIACIMPMACEEANLNSDSYPQKARFVNKTCVHPTIPRIDVNIYNKHTKNTHIWVLNTVEEGPNFALAKRGLPLFFIRVAKKRVEKYVQKRRANTQSEKTPRRANSFAQEMQNHV